MATFLEIFGSHINLDHVDEISYEINKKEGPVTNVRYSDGHVRHFFGRHEPPGRIIPAAPGYWLAIAWLPDATEQIECADEELNIDEYVWLYSIIAWKMIGDWPEAITINGTSDTGATYSAIFDPLGQVVMVEDSAYKTQSEWKRAMKERWLKARQERAHEPAPAA